MYGDFPAKNTVYTLYTPVNVWFWPTLLVNCNVCWPTRLLANGV